MLIPDGEQVEDDILLVIEIKNKKAIFSIFENSGYSWSTYEYKGNGIAEVKFSKD